MADFRPVEIHDDTGPVVDAIGKVITNTNQMVQQLSAVSSSVAATEDNTSSDPANIGATTDDAVLTDADGTVIAYLRGLVTYRSRAEEVQLLTDILFELKKLNIQLSLITDKEITEGDTK